MNESAPTDFSPSDTKPPDFQSSGFQRMVDHLKPEGDGYRTQVLEDAWGQGRTLFGGLTAGLATAAAKLSVEQLPPLRSVQVNFIGPVGFQPLFLPQLLRRGKNSAIIHVDVIADGQVATRCQLVFGNARKSELSVPAEPGRKFPAPESVEPFVMKQMMPFVPPFFRQFDTRLLEGARPISGADTGYIHVWSRHRDSDSRSGIAALVAIADVLPPAGAAMLNTPGPMSSMTWMLNFLTEEPLTDDGWWRLDTRLTSAGNGYTSQKMSIWNRRGEQVAEGLQNVAIFA